MKTNIRLVIGIFSCLLGVGFLFDERTETASFVFIGFGFGLITSSTYGGKK
jgi:hypothetical protein